MWMLRRYEWDTHMSTTLSYWEKNKNFLSHLKKHCLPFLLHSSPFFLSSTNEFGGLIQLIPLPWVRTREFYTVHFWEIFPHRGLKEIQRSGESPEPEVRRAGSVWAEYSLRKSLPYPGRGFSYLELNLADIVFYLPSCPQVWCCD